MAKHLSKVLALLGRSDERELMNPTGLIQVPGEIIVSINCGFIVVVLIKDLHA